VARSIRKVKDDATAGILKFPDFVRLFEKLERSVEKYKSVQTAGQLRSFLKARVDLARAQFTVARGLVENIERDYKCLAKVAKQRGLTTDASRYLKTAMAELKAFLG
jgi:hypothetical protein